MVNRKLLVLAALLAALAAPGVTANASTVLVLDTGDKASAYLPQQIVEAKDLLAHLGDGERVAVVRTAPTRTVFDNILGSETRVALGSSLATVYSVKSGSDLGAALAVAVSLAARGPGPKRVVLFTPGESRPPKRSAFYGKSFEALLAGVPQDTTLTVRLYGGAALNATPGNVRVLRDTPRWQEEPAFAPPASPEPVRPSEEPAAPRPAAHRFGVWLAAGGAMLAALATLGFWVWRRRRATAAVRRREEEERQMLNAASQAERDKDPDEILVFIVDTGAGESSLGDGDSLTAGDRWDAEPFFSAAGACVRFSARASALTIENIGTSAISVGTLTLAPGSSRRLPVKYLEVTVGDRIVTVMPEVVRRTAGSGVGEPILDARQGVM
jgi:hypothetical protein